MEKKITIIGGLGIENRTIICQGESATYSTIGGSAWFTGITAVALSCEAEIISRLGDDNNAAAVKKILQEKGLHYLGNCVGLTQEFYSKIINGEPQSYIAKHPNQTIEQLNDILSKVTLSNIVVITFNDIDFYSNVRLIKKRLIDPPFLVANPSGVIFEMGDQFLQIVTGYNLVTMNIKEANYLSKLYKCTLTGVLEKITKTNQYAIVTSKNSVIYAYNGLIHKYDFKPIENISDATGAGDSFAVTAAVALHNNDTIEIAIIKAITVAQQMCKVANKVDIQPMQWGVCL